MSVLIRQRDPPATLSYWCQPASHKGVTGPGSPSRGRSPMWLQNQAHAPRESQFSYLPEELRPRPTPQP